MRKSKDAAPPRKKFVLGKVKLRKTTKKKDKREERMKLAYKQMQDANRKKKERLKDALEKKRSRKHDIRSKQLVDRTPPSFETMKVLVVQYGMGLRGHVKRISNLLKKHSPVDFVVCPENFAPPKFAEEIGVEMAKTFGTYFNGGSGVNMKKDKRFNTAIVVDRKGSVLVSYDKRKAWTGQECGSSAGFFKTDKYGTGSVLICYDIEDEDLVQESIDANVRVIVNPTHIPTHRRGNEKDSLDWNHGLEEMTKRLGYYAKKHNFCVFRSDVRSSSVKRENFNIMPLTLTRTSLSEVLEHQLTRLKRNRSSRMQLLNSRFALEHRYLDRLRVVRLRSSLRESLDSHRHHTSRI